MANLSIQTELHISFSDFYYYYKNDHKLISSYLQYANWTEFENSSVFHVVEMLELSFILVYIYHLGIVSFSVHNKFSIINWELV